MSHLRMIIAGMVGGVGAVLAGGLGCGNSGADPDHFRLTGEPAEHARVLLNRLSALASEVDKVPVGAASGTGVEGVPQISTPEPLNFDTYLNDAANALLLNYINLTEQVMSPYPKLYGNKSRVLTSFRPRNTPWSAVAEALVNGDTKSDRHRINEKDMRRHLGALEQARYALVVRWLSHTPPRRQGATYLGGQVKGEALLFQLEPRKLLTTFVFAGKNTSDIHHQRTTGYQGFSDRAGTNLRESAYAAMWAELKRRAPSVVLPKYPH